MEVNLIRILLSALSGKSGRVPVKPSIVIIIGIILFMFILCGDAVGHAQPGIQVPEVEFRMGGAGEDEPEELVGFLQLMLALAILSLAPSFLVLMTSFTRLVIVMGLMRNAMATQSVPPNQVVVGLALFLTYFIMYPIFDQINQEAVQPYLEGEISQQEAIDTGIAPLRTFMFEQTRDKDLALFVNISEIDEPEDEQDIPLHVLVPAFVISELKTAFEMGFWLFIPFLIMDMVVASTLMAMGMMMLPPVIVSLPFKILLFILVDGWHLVIKSLVESFL